MTDKTEKPDKKSLLTVRAALIFLVALLIGGVVGTLSFLATGSWAAATLAGLTAMGASVPVLNEIIS